MSHFSLFVKIRAEADLDYWRSAGRLRSRICSPHGRLQPSASIRCDPTLFYTLQTQWERWAEWGTISVWQRLRIVVVQWAFMKNNGVEHRRNILDLFSLAFFNFIIWWRFRTNNNINGCQVNAVTSTQLVRFIASIVGLTWKTDGVRISSQLWQYTSTHSSWSLRCDITFKWHIWAWTAFILKCFLKAPWKWMDAFQKTTQSDTTLPQ